MPAALSVDTFAELVQRSRLLSADQVQQVLQELEAEGKQVDSPEDLADALVRRELLTSWQVGFLLKGKHSGFFLGSYRFLKMLGKGGMGAVYLAEHQMMRRRCAIKVLPTKLISESSSVLDRFYLEAQAVAALDDPNIVRAYDVNKEMQGKREIHYLVMEYVDGCDLQVLVQRKGPLEYVQVADFARQAASGLAHAHECGLIHRDIKPANLLIDERGIVKILDLGLARFFDDRLDASLTTTHNESILGTADYLSPEQALDSHKVDTRTDIYSLGCTCYFMLAGHPPFPEGSVAQRLMSHQAKSPKAIEKIRPDAPADLVTIVEKMIAKSADDRYQTAREVADVFTAWLTRHAGEDWKKSHRDILEGSVSQIRHEPTRTRSAATEETDLDLGLAVTEELGLAPGQEEDASLAQGSAVTRAADSQTPTPQSPTITDNDGELGLDQLEELDPLTAGLDTGSPSGGLDSLLNEALDNFPAFDYDSNVTLPTAQAGMASGIQGPKQAAAPASAESKQLLRLILIGFAVSVPLSIVILVVSSRFETPAESSSIAMSNDASEDEVPSSDDEPTDKQSPASLPANPAAEEVKPAIVRTTQPQETSGKPEPSTSTKDPLGSTSPEPSTSDPVAMTTAAGATAQQASDAASVNAPKADPEPSKITPETQPAKTVPPVGRDTAPEVTSDTDDSEPAPPSPARKKELLASLTEVTIKLDREVDRKTLAYDLMVLKTAQEALERAGLKVTSESQDDSSAIMTLKFDSERAGAGIVFHLGGELKCPDGDSRQVVIWSEQEDVGPMSTSVLGPTPPSVLRNKVSGFFNAVSRDYRRAVAGND